MKKLFLFAVLTLSFLLSTNAQEPSGVSIPIVQYEIDTTGYSHGLTITNPFYISVTSLTAEIDTAVGFMLMSYTVTSTDSNLVNKVFNDSVPSMKVFPLTIVAVGTLTLVEMVEDYIKQNLIEIYGVNNVAKLE